MCICKGGHTVGEPFISKSKSPAWLCKAQSLPHDPVCVTLLKLFQYDHNNVIRNWGELAHRRTQCSVSWRVCVQVSVCKCLFVTACVCLCKYISFPFIHVNIYKFKIERQCVHVNAYIQNEQQFPRLERQDYGTFRSRNSSVSFQTSFTLSKVKSIKHTHVHKHTHTDKRVVSVTLVNRVSINLIVPI